MLRREPEAGTFVGTIQNIVDYAQYAAIRIVQYTRSSAGEIHGIASLVCAAKLKCGAGDLLPTTPPRVSSRVNAPDSAQASLPNAVNLGRLRLFPFPRSPHHSAVRGHLGHAGGRPGYDDGQSQE